MKPGPVFRVGKWRVDAVDLTISTATESRRIDQKQMDLLTFLSERQGDIVTREQLLEALWPNQMLGDDVLNVAVSNLRKALDDSTRAPSFIKTLPRKGYQLIAEVRTGRPSRESPWRAAVAVLMLLAIVAVAFIAARDSAPASPLTGAARLAVLPFDLFSEDPGQRYIADGLTEAIINQLVQLPDLQVTSRSSVMSYREERPQVPEIAAALNVDWILEGSVQVEDGELRVTAQLIEAAADSHVWSQTYQRPLRDLLFIQTEIATSIGSRFGDSPSTTKAPSPDAFDAFLRGRYYRSERDFDRATAAFHEALKIQPDYAAAEAALAVTRFVEAYFSDQGRLTLLTQARQNAERAAAIDSAASEVSLARALVAYFLDRDDEQAGVWFERAFAEDHQDVALQEWFVQYLITTGDWPRAESLVDHMVRVNPLAYNKMSRFYLAYYRGDFDQAAEELRSRHEFLGDGPYRTGLYLWLALAIGDAESAAEHGADLLRHYDAEDGAVEAFSKEALTDGTAAALAARIDAIGDRIGTLGQAEMLAFAGEFEPALAILEAEVGRMNFSRLTFHREPPYLGMRKHPRFRELLSQQKLLDYLSAE